MGVSFQWSTVSTSVAMTAHMGTMTPTVRRTKIRMEQTNNTHPLTRITWKLNEEEGLLDVYGHFLSDEGKVQTCKVASLALGTGYVVWCDQAYTRDELLCNELDNLDDICRKYPVRVGSKITSMLKELVALNEKRAKLASEIARLLDDHYELGLQDNMLDPLQTLTSSNFVSGTVQKHKDGTKALSVEGHRRAGANGPDGLFCWQTIGYCEDDFSGEQFVRMDDGIYLCIPFEF